MRAADILLLALDALYQRLLRTTLSVVGVAVGSFVLLTSLAIGMGVQDLVLEQLRKQDQLRRIVVWSRGGRPAKDDAGPDVTVKGEMSEERRERLREAIKRRWRGAGTPAGRVLTEEHRRELAALPHVREVVQRQTWFGQSELAGRTVPTEVRTTVTEDNGLARRVVAGRTFRPDEEGVLVSEYLAYRWGMIDDPNVDTLPGEEMRLKLNRPGPQAADLAGLLVNARPDLTDEEKKSLGAVLKKLPAALAQATLEDEEREVLLKVLGREKLPPRPPRELTLPVVGVYRDVTREEVGPWSSLPSPADVLVSRAVAEGLQRTSTRPGGSVFQVTVVVDREENLRETEDAIKDMGLETFSLLEVLDQLRLNILLIGIACTFVALMALGVAALGIANTMLMSVLERTHEIGVLKATGARDSQVMRLFLAEGMIVGLLGAVVGLAAAWGVSFPGDRLARYLIAAQTPMRVEGSVFLFPAWMVVLVPVLVAMFTTIAAIYPARRAARIEPIVALRER